jgi:putative hemolysin
MSGILTLEDLLEEIVGEINDEYDDEESPIVELSNGHFVVDASIPIAELARQAGIELPDGDEYNSLGGFIVEVMGRVPESGAVLEKLGHRFLIRSADERRISKVEIVPAA